MKNLLWLSLILLSLIACEKKQEVTPVKVIPKKEYAGFKGHLFGKEVDISEKGRQIKNTSGMPPEGDPNEFYLGTSIANQIFFDKAHERNFFSVVVNEFKVYPNFLYGGQDSVYQYLKRVLTVGKKQKIPLDRENHWHTFIIKDTHFYGHTTEDGAEIEILEVREVDTKTITSEAWYYPKAFWVTFKVKDRFDEIGEIDGTLKVKYAINRPYSMSF